MASTHERSARHWTPVAAWRTRQPLPVWAPDPQRGRLGRVYWWAGCHPRHHGIGTVHAGSRLAPAPGPCAGAERGSPRKLRQLEEQVKLIPVLQVKLSVLQEEKRTTHSAAQEPKVLGPLLQEPGGRGELCLTSLRPPRTQGHLETRSVGTWVQSGLGRARWEAALAAKVAVRLETQLKKALQSHRQLKPGKPTSSSRPASARQLRGPSPVRVVQGPRDGRWRPARQRGLLLSGPRV